MFFFYQCPACRKNICSKQYFDPKVVVKTIVVMFCESCKQTKNFNYASQTTQFTPNQTRAFKASNPYKNCVAVEVDVEADKKKK